MKKWMIGIGVVVVFIGIFLVGKNLLLGKEKVATKQDETKQLGITYYDVPEIAQVYINGKVQPEQAKAYTVSEELKKAPVLKVTNGQIVEAGTLLYELEDTAITNELEAQTTALNKQSTRKQNITAKWNKALDQWKKTPAEERSTTKEALDSQFQDEMTSVQEEIQALNESIATLKAKQMLQTVADFKGKVTIPEVKEANTPILRLTSENLYVAGTVNEKDLTKIRLNQKATLTIVSNGTSVSGHISYIDSNPPEATSTSSGTETGQGAALSNYKVKLAIDEPEKVKNGFHVQAAVTVGEEKPITIPQKAVRTEGGTHYVLVNDFGSVIRRTPVLGGTEGDKITVVSGLEAGDRIIVSSKEPVKEGDILQDASTKAKE